MNGDLGTRFRQQSGELSSFVLDSLRGLLETIQYGTGQARLEEMNAKTDQLLVQEEKMKRLTGRNTAMTNTVILAFDLVMLWASTLLSMNGVIGFDGVLISVIALMSSFGPVVALANLGSTLQNTFAAGNRVLDILDETPVVFEISGQPEITFENAKVDHVTFSYGQETILSDISIDVPKHSVIGISGRSGSGKSTLLKLLMRFWSAQQGQIQISNTDIDAINTENLRNMESFVTQETHLFHDTIANNLRIAKLDATQEEIEAACQKASVHDFIMSLPNGYDTQVGELGDTLSGGEQTKIRLSQGIFA